MSYQENIGKNLIKNVEVTIGDNKTKVDNIDGKLKIEHYYKDILQKTENKNIDNTTTLEYLPLSTYFTVDGKLKTEKIEKVEPIRICVDTINQSINYNRDLHSPPPIPKKIISPWTTPWRQLDKQTYTEIEINNIYELISKHPDCIIEKYDIIDLNDSVCDTLIDIADYMYGDKDLVEGSVYYNFIYNNISVFMQDDREISKPYIEYRYIKSHFDICDLNKMKKVFNFIYIKQKNEVENKYYDLDKQTYSERELVQNLELIGKHPECIIEKYDTINWTDLTYDTIIDIADYIYEDYIKGGQDGLCFFSFIYNNICVYIQNDSEISEPYIEYKYVKSQIDICDLNAIKKTFNFLNIE